MSTDPAKPLTVRVVSTIAEVPRGAWDACANPGWPSDAPLGAEGPADRLAYNPFVSFDFLDCLEASGSATGRTGWTPRHFLLESAGKVVGVMPAYVKSHSMGEYVFDHGWADAFDRAGGHYYPKLQVSVPFTPATGRRFLVPPGPETDLHAKTLAAAATGYARREKLSSAHVTFLTEAEWQMCAELGYLQRTDQQFQFVNDGYRDFDDFLAALASRKRKAVRRERADAVAGIDVQELTGGDLTEDAWDAFFAFYMDTGSRKWGRPYLNRRFFSLVGERMADRILLFIAKRNGKPIAGALNFIGSDTLFGRYWGSTEHQPFLHFELCYYRAIDWGITHGLKRVEAGAQGEHKLARGYVPTPTYSAHWIADPRLRTAIAEYLEHEREQSARELEMLAAHAPFRHEDGEA